MKPTCFVLLWMVMTGSLRAQSFSELQSTNEAELVRVVEASKADQSRKKTFFALLRLGNLYLNQNLIPQCDSVLGIIKTDYKDLVLNRAHWRTLDVADYYQLLSSFYYAKNDNKKSKRFLEKAQKVNPNIFSYTNNSYRLFIREGKLDSAEMLLQRTFPSLAKDLDIHKLDGELLNSFNLTFRNMCQLMIMKGDLDGLRFYLSKWIHMSKGRVDDPSRVKKKRLKGLLPWQLIYLAKYYVLKGYMDDAHRVLQLTVKMQDDDDLKLEGLRSWAQYYYIRNNSDSAIYYLKETLDFHKEKIKGFFRFFTETERENYINELNDDYDLFLSVITENPDVNKRHLPELFEFQLFRKGLLLDITKKLNKVTAKFSSEKALELMRQIGTVNDSIAMITFKKSLFQGLLKKELLISKLYSRKESYEKALLLEIKASSSNLFDNVKISNITAKLPGDGCLVEVIRFRKWIRDPKRITSVSGMSYAILVISREKDPELIFIPNGEELEGRFAKLYKNSIQAQIGDTLLYNIYWAGISSATKGYKKIFLSPDGVYNLINVNTLEDPHSGQFVIDGVEVINLTSPKDLLDNVRVKDVNMAALLLGYPLYSFSPPLDERQASSRGAIIESLENIKAAEFDPLPATRDEVEQIDRIIRKQNGTTVLLEGKDATETNLKAAKIPAILHLATHGFFVSSQNNLINPLLKSGLVLAGVNNTMNTDDSDQDGVLTAFEIAALNLENTQLVVLSACETGLGDLKNGDGVYGLQRAFKIAEAKYLILSMWKVDDEATMKLMTLFYTSLLKTKDVPSSFNLAQKELRQTYPSPYYWGAFKLIGN